MKTCAGTWCPLSILFEMDTIVCVLVGYRFHECYYLPTLDECTEQCAGRVTRGGLALSVRGWFYPRQVANSMQGRVCLWCLVSVHSLAKHIGFEGL